MKSKKPAKQPMKRARRASRGRKGSAKPKANMFNARHHHDAMGKVYPLAVPGQTANFVTINGLVRANVTTAGTKILLFTWCPSQVVRFSIFKMDDRKWSGPNYTRLGTETGRVDNGSLPVSLRPLRMSVRIRNTTVGHDVGGSVRVLQADDWPLTELENNVNPYGISTECKNRWQSYVDTHPMTHTYSAAELRTTHKFIIKPGQEIPFKQYHTFKQGMQANNNDNKEFGVSGEMFIFARTQEPMTALVMYMPEVPDSQNTYEITVHYQDAAQYEPASALHAQARPAPPANEGGFRANLGALRDGHIGMIEG